jgi:hypothetical protein
MTHTNEVLANEAAMRNPVEALKVLRVTTQSCRHTTTETFLQAYIQVNGGVADNPITMSNVEAAVNDWFRDRSIPRWLARACVLAEKYNASA